MTLQFAPSAVVPQLVALQALTQLNRRAVFARAATVNYEAGTFERSDKVTVRRARIMESQDYDPRSGVPANSTEPGYFSASLELERLFTAGFPVYSADNQPSIDRYVSEYATQIASAIVTQSDNYVYNKFRALALPGAGQVSYGASAPLAIVAAEDDNGISDFNKNALIAANSYLDGQEVPPDNRIAILSTVAKGGFLGDSIMTEGFNALGAGGPALLANGLPVGTFIDRYGFSVGGSTAVTYQAGATAVDAATPGSEFVGINAATQNTDFLEADFATPTLLGAIDFELAPAALTPDVAAGTIARIGGNSGKAAAFGMILRVNGNIVTMVPYSAKGVKLNLAQVQTIIASAQFSIPTLGSVNVAYHREAMLIANRQLAAPSEGSGARMITEVNAQTNLIMQVLLGSYQIDSFKESQRYAVLMGALLSDHRKACLIVSE